MLESVIETADLSGQVHDLRLQIFDGFVRGRFVGRGLVRHGLELRRQRVEFGLKIGLVLVILVLGRLEGYDLVLGVAQLQHVVAQGLPQTRFGRGRRIVGFCKRRAGSDQDNEENEAFRFHNQNFALMSNWTRSLW